jgi:hypothetical protein
MLWIFVFLLHVGVRGSCPMYMCRLATNDFLAQHLKTVYGVEHGYSEVDLESRVVLELYVAAIWV